MNMYGKFTSNFLRELHKYRYKYVFVKTGVEL